MACSGPGAEPVCLPAEKGRQPRSKWLRFVTYLVAAGALGYVLAHLNVSDLASGVSRITWWPVVLAIVLHNIPRLVQAFRWAYLLRPAVVRPFLLLHALFIGILMSGIFPLCPNDLVRGVIVSRRTGMGVARVFTSQAIERAADGVALALLVGLTIRGLSVPAYLNHALLALIALVGVVTMVGLGLTLQHRRLEAYLAPRQPAGRIGRWLKMASLEVLAGAKAVKGWTMPICISLALGMVAMQVVSMWLLLYAYHLHLSLIQAAALVGIVTVGTLIPNAPASVGPWQFFCVLGLGLFGVPAGEAAGFSLVAFAIFTVPALLGGVIALVVSPMSWADMRRRHEREPIEARPDLLLQPRQLLLPPAP